MLSKKTKSNFTDKFLILKIKPVIWFIIKKKNKLLIKSSLLKIELKLIKKLLLFNLLKKKLGLKLFNKLKDNNW